MRADPRTTAFVEPLSITVPLRAREVVVTDAKVRQLAAMTRLLAPLLDSLARLPAETIQRFSEGVPNAADMAELLRVVAEDPEVLVELCSVATDVPVAELGELHLDEAVTLFCYVMHVNADFFGRARSTLIAAAGLLNAQKPEAVPGDSTTTGPSASTS